MHFTKDIISEKLVARHEAFMAQIDALPKGAFEASVNGKWSAGQQLEHIWLSVKPLVRLLQSEGVLQQMELGKVDRDPMNYTELTTVYTTTLMQGGKATPKFIPEPVSYGEKGALIAKLKEGVVQLAQNILGFEEEALDDYAVPHPLLRLLSVREILYFTLYHVKHHHKQLP